MRWRMYLIATAPIEVIGCAFWGAWRGLRDGWLNVRDEWHERRMREHR
jgi:hypothetical protein